MAEELAYLAFAVEQFWAAKGMTLAEASRFTFVLHRQQ